MITKEQLIGMLLIKAKYRVNIKLNHDSAIGYGVSVSGSISSNENMMVAIKRTLQQLQVPYYESGVFRIIFGKKACRRILEIIPESMDELNGKGLPTLREVMAIMEEKGHKTLDGLEKIFEIMGYENGSNEHEQ